jgi:uncharacterized protein (TIGR00299 family) protein
MRIAYFDCFSGFAGDMALGALVDAGASPEALTRAIAPLGLGREFEIRFERVTRGALAATKARIDVLLDKNSPMAARTLYDVRTIIERAGLEPRVAAQAIAIFTRLAAAEARVHGASIETVHFHEVGAVDAIVDVCGTCAGLALLGVDAVFSSEACVGRGSIRSAHGEIPAPGPATLYLLEGRPVRSRDVGHELTTPTGAAILAELARGWGPIPAMTIRAIGVGAGDADLATHSNVCRVIVGDASAPPADPAPAAISGPTTASADRVIVLEANLDDLPGQLVATAIEACLRAGALDAYAVPCVMKKGRPAVVFTAIAHESDVARVEAAIFAETTTLGIRRHACDRTVLGREVVTVETPLGAVEVKLGRRADGAVLTAQPEFESVRKLAEARGIPVRAAHALALEAAAKLRGA